MKDYYKILELERNASDDEIKKSYRRLAVKYHPDKNTETGAEERFKEIAEAYEILSDPQKRNNYDNFGSADGRSNGGGGFNPFEEMFNQFRGGGFNPFERTMNVKGQDINIKLKLTIKEMIEGCQKKISVNRRVTCNDCNGNGSLRGNNVTTCSVCNGSGKQYRVQNLGMAQIRQEVLCNSCNGKGKNITQACPKCHTSGSISSTDEINVDVPGGVVPGNTLQNHGMGSMSNGATIPGDLYITIDDAEEDNLSRHKLDVIADIRVSFLDLINGADINVNDPVNKVIKVTIKPFTQSGAIFRLQGKGIKSIQTGMTGDFIIIVHANVPKDLSKAEIEDLNVLKNKLKPTNTIAGVFKNLFKLL